MLLTAIATLLCLVGILFTFLTAATLTFYFGRVPGGADAMGLIIPFFTAAIGGLAAVFGAAAAGGRFPAAALGLSRASLVWGMAGAGLLVGLSILGAFCGWAEKHPLAHPLVLLFSGLILPMGFFVFTLQVAWTEPAAPALSPALKAGGGVALLAAMAGVTTVGLMIHAYVASTIAHAGFVREQMEQGKAEEDRRAAMTPEARLLEDLARYSHDSPLWTLTAGLPDESNRSLRQIWIERALQHPNFEAELRGTITCPYGVYRHGCCVLLAEMDEARVNRTEWAALLAEDARLTAEDIGKCGDLGKHQDDWLALHVKNLVRAAARVDRTEALTSALSKLRTAVEATPESVERRECLQVL